MYNNVMHYVLKLAKFSISTFLLVSLLYNCSVQSVWASDYAEMVVLDFEQFHTQFYGKVLGVNSVEFETIVRMRTYKASILSTYLVPIVDLWGAHNDNNNMIVRFPFPVNLLTYNVCVDSATSPGQVEIYDKNGVIGRKNIIADGDNNTKDPNSLVEFNNITKLIFYPDDPAGLGFDDFSFTYNSCDNTPFVLDYLNYNTTFHSILISEPSCLNSIGKVTYIIGNATIKRSDGTIISLILGTEIYMHDIIETKEESNVHLLLTDGTYVQIPGNESLAIDEYMYDNTPSNNSGESLLKKIFQFTSGLIIHNKPKEDITIWGPGIRGSAEDIVSEDLLNNPNPSYGNIGIWVETASPVGVSTVAKITDGKLNLSFDYIFLGEKECQLQILLGGTNILTLSLDPSQNGRTQHVETGVEYLPTEFVKLTFLIDGSAENGLIFTNLELADRSLLSFDNWYKEGKGPVEFVFLTTSEQLYQLVQDAKKRTDSNSDIPGDLNGNSSVDLDDYYEVFEPTYAKCTGDASYNPVCDFDNDGCVTLPDLYTLYQYYLDYQATLNPQP